MEEFIQKLTNLLRAHFKDCEVDLEFASPPRIGGFLIWEGFTGREQIERQREVWRLLRSSFSPQEQAQVSAILTLTPEEMAAARHG